MRICLDASAIIDWSLPQGAQGPRALDRFLTTASETFAPPLLYAESTSTMRRLVHTHVLTEKDAESSLLDLFALSIVVVHDLDLYRRALHLATRLGHARAYDTQYIAVAEVTGAVLLTADGGMHSNAGRVGIPCEIVQ